MYLNKIKFTKQRAAMDCVPAAICNAIKWAGWKVSYRDCRHFFDFLFKCDEEEGACSLSFKKFLSTSKWLPFKLTKVKEGMNIKDLMKAVNGNHSCILIVPNGHGYHATFVVSINNHHATLINWDKKQAVRKMTLKKLNQHLKSKAIGYILRKI